MSHRVIYAVKTFEVDGKEQSRWTRIGTAFKNKDGSENLLFDFTPTDPAVTIQIRDPKEREDKPE